MLIANVGDYRWLDATDVVADRVSAIDSEFNQLRKLSQSCLSEALDFAIRLMDMSHVSGQMLQPDGTILPEDISVAAEPKDLDGVVGHCRLLAEVANIAPDLAYGPLRRQSQYWISTGRPNFLPTGSSSLEEKHFVAATRDDIPHAAKPFGLGLYTSSGFQGSFGMWFIRLEQQRGTTELHSLPWAVWHVNGLDRARVLEIRSARDWVGLVRSHGVRDGMFIYPDWARIAERWDAVHMSLSAVIAAHGICFRVGDHVTAPGYWSVESTFWLRWQFAKTALVQSIHAS